jgi:tetratricopeptide (TPR) repeat protein
VENLKNIGDGRELAEVLGTRFFQYGDALVSGRRRGLLKPETITSRRSLTPERKREVDEWLIGAPAYRRRVERLYREYGNEIPESELEEERNQMLNAYFGALSREGYREADKEKPWQISEGPFHRLQRKASEQIEQKLNVPEHELYQSVFRRGMELLKEGVGVESIDGKLKELGYVLEREKMKLVEVLQIDRLREEIAQVRERGDIEKISQKELEVARIIQNAVSRYKYTLDLVEPLKVQEGEHRNCVGATILGTALLESVGIATASAQIILHQINLIATSDGNVYWWDMLAPQYNEKLQNDDVEGYDEKRTKITIDDIALFIRSDEMDASNQLRLSVSADWYSRLHDRLGVDIRGQKRYLHINRKETIPAAMLNTIGVNAALQEKDIEAGIKLLEKAIEFDPNYLYSRENLATFLEKKGRVEEAEEQYRKIIEIEPQFEDAYSGLASLLRKKHSYEDAIRVLDRGLKVNSHRAGLWLERGQCFFDSRDYSAAEENFRRSIEVVPDNERFNANLAHALELQERYAEAESFYRKAIELNKTYNYAHRKLAMLLERQKRYSSATEVYKTLVGLLDNERDKEAIRKKIEELENASV